MEISLQKAPQIKQHDSCYVVGVNNTQKNKNKNTQKPCPNICKWFWICYRISREALEGTINFREADVLWKYSG